MSRRCILGKGFYVKWLCLLAAVDVFPALPDQDRGIVSGPGLPVWSVISTPALATPCLGHWNTHRSYPSCFRNTANMRTPFSILSIFALSAVVHHASADDDARTISPVGCVAPSAFQDCLNQATMIETTCIDDATDAEVVVACGTIFLINEMQCYYESCWNKVCQTNILPC